jgi:Prealbumin-like fold domain
MKHARKRSRWLIVAGLLGSTILIIGWALPTASAAPVMIVDDGGPDDYPGQKDLNYLTVDYAPGTPGTIIVEWGWDDTAWSGNNTGDACSLFDTDGDGFANYSLCVTVGGTPASYQDLRLYSCGDTRTDRCDQPTTLITPVSSTATVALPANSDPFGVPSSPYYAPSHVTGNTCGTSPGCYTTDTVATVNVVLNDIGGGADPFLLNVCSYPSEEPNSAPSECVITPNAGFLTIVKVADPDDATDFVFNMGTGQESTTGEDTWTITGSGSVQMIPFDSGTDYDLSEVVPSQWNLDSAECVLQTSPTATTGIETSTGVEDFEVQAGVETICTFNDSKQAYITVTKVVTNDDGGNAAPDDFNLTLEGDPVTSGVAVPVDPGTYTAGETLLSGYTFEGFSGDCDSNGDITVAAGESKSCTLTNNDQQAYVTVTKVVTNDDGGSALPNDFALTLEGDPVTSGVAVPVDPGTYTAGETLLDGYTFEGFSGDCDSNGDVTVALGQSKSCTLTNNDQQAYITVTKVVTNDDGGNAAPDDFNLTLEGDPVTSGVAVPVDPGTYTAGETQLPGYTFEGFTGDCDSSGDVTVALGESKSCTLTNNDEQATITVFKTVINDNGGTAQPDDFLLTLEGTSVLSGEVVSVDPGTYTAGETLLDGYTFEGFSGDCDANGDVTVALGQSKSCTLTNNDQQATITVVKVVNNDHGGTAAPDDFDLTLEGTPVDSGVAVNVNPGTYTAGETLLPGYTFDGFSGACDSNGDVTVALGEDKTCTLTNSDIEPKLTVVKTVVNDNGGTLQVSDFPLFVDSTSVFSGEKNGFDAGTHTVSEPEQFGYEAGDWGGDCAADGTITLQLADDKTCTITNDDEPGTIVIIKQATPQSGTFHFTSTTDDGNNATLPPLADFDLNGDPAGGGNQYSQDLDAGTYTVQEAMQAGWILTGIGGSSDPNTPYACTVEGQGGSSGSGDLATQTVTVDLEVGDTVTCVFENSGQGVTRTQGFWATHPYLAQIAWDGGTSEFFPYHTFAGVAATPGIGDKLICGREVVTGTTADSDGVMGAFWSKIAKKTTGVKRTAIDKARMTLLQQLIAAELNASAFGTVPPGGVGMFAQWEAALCGTNITAIRNAASQAASFNESGDGGSFTPGTSADPKYARFIADKVFWNIVKP